MEIFIDLAKLTEAQPAESLPGIDLNLSGLVNFNKPTDQLSLAQNQLKTESELAIPGFNPIEYFAQIQSEFDKIKLAQASTRLADERTLLQEAQANSNVALDSIASYLETRLDKIESISTVKEELKQSIQSTISNPLTQTTAIERDKVDTILPTVVELISAISTVEKPTVGDVNSNVVNNQLVNTQETRVDQTSQSISNLSDTVSNFATNIVNGNTANEVLNYGSETLLSEPKREPLSMTKEVSRPDLSMPTLSALQQMADNTQQLTTASNILNTTSSQFNTNNVNQDVLTGSTPSGNAASPTNNTIVTGSDKTDHSAVYLMQMLNLMKSGQLKVKLQ